MKKDTSKTKYSCPICNSNAWAKPESQLTCTKCGVQLESEWEDG